MIQRVKYIFENLNNIIEFINLIYEETDNESEPARRIIQIVDEFYTSLSVKLKWVSRNF